MDILLQWAGPLAAVLSTATAVYTFLTRGSRENAKDISALRIEIAGIERKRGEMEPRLSALENEMRHLPDKETVHKLELTVSDMAGAIKVMAETTSATSRAVGRLEEWAMKQAGTK